MLMLQSGRLIEVPWGPISWVSGGTDVLDPVRGADHGECTIDLAQCARTAFEGARTRGFNACAHDYLLNSSGEVRTG